jgi:heme-degrading monooxygenase HmoA
MAVVVVNEVEGGTQEFYDQVNSKVMPGQDLPDGAELHIAGPTENGWRVITVWESEEKFNQFRTETLIPTLKEAGGDDRVAPSIKADPVYRLIKA